MHIGSILLSIQSLLCNNPLHNEPGFEKEAGEKNDLYNLVVEYDNYNHLIRKNGFEIHPMFNTFDEIIKNHLKKEKDRIIERLDDLEKKHPKPAKISLNIYNIMMPINYPQLRTEIVDRLNNL